MRRFNWLEGGMNLCKSGMYSKLSEKSYFQKLYVLLPRAANLPLRADRAFPEKQMGVNSKIFLGAGAPSPSLGGR